MDLKLFLAVIWRSKLIVLAGVLLALVLAALAYGRPSLAGGHPSLTPRAAQVWQSESQLLISQAGFPYRQAAESSNLAQPLGNLSPIYANLANGNIVQDQIHSQLGPIGSVKASEDIDAAASSFLPFVNLVATAPTRSGATRLAHGAAVIFLAYVARQQALASIPPKSRIQLSLVESGASAKLVEGQKLSVPILVFLAVMVAILTMVFVRENLQPRVGAELVSLSPDAPSQGLHLEEPDIDEPHIGMPQRHLGHAGTNGVEELGVHRTTVVTGDVRQ
jgi:hypothetical protein